MGPLTGVTVLDISRLLPGGYASLLLRELGARVIKIEQPGIGDYYRAVFKGEGILGSGQVCVINQGKESLGLDLKSPEGKGIFRKLVRRADVVIENFRPGVLKKLGLSYPSLRRIHPKVILCSITGFGQKGDLRRLAGHDLNYLGLSGLLSRVRDGGGRMVIPDFQVIDLAAGLEAALRISAALYQRGKKGCWIDCAMLKTGYSLSRLYMSRATEGRSPSGGSGEAAALQMGGTGGERLSPPAMMLGGSERSPVGGGLIRYGVYETADGRFVTLGALEPKFWDRFCRVIGHADWAEGAERFEFLGEERRAALEAVFKSKTADEWVQIGAREDLCLFPVERIQDLPPGSPKKTPALGEQTGKILRSLGYRAAEIRVLRKKGVVT